MRAPDTVFIAITFDDGSVGIMQFVTAEYNDKGLARWQRVATDEAIGVEIMRSAFEHVPVSWKRISKDDVPTDRAYRDAWVESGGAITHDMPKARALHLTRLREKRDRRLAALDGPWMRAVGQGDKVEADRIETERQALRDLPQTLAPQLSAAQSVDELKLVDG